MTYRFPKTDLTIKAPIASDSTVTIRYDYELSVFELFNDQGEFIACHDRPKELCSHAWSSGARVIRHDYDLKLAEF